ncbi:MAG: DUF3098 domain-containing protein [Bacteroidaceae bacterium]|nr:DUF3098 domain-containing protein [Bacteroidaceae bacterium]
MDKRNYAFGKINYILLVVGLLIVVTGLFLMSGSGTTEEAFNPDIFSSRRIDVAPMVCLAGFVFIVFGILFPSRDLNKGKEE